jgi:hypothetical protein
MIRGLRDLFEYGSSPPWVGCSTTLHPLSIVLANCVRESLGNATSPGRFVHMPPVDVQ